MSSVQDFSDNFYFRFVRCYFVQQENYQNALLYIYPGINRINDFDLNYLYDYNPMTESLKIILYKDLTGVALRRARFCFVNKVDYS